MGLMAQQQAILLSNDCREYQVDLTFLIFHFQLSLLILIPPSLAQLDRVSDSDSEGRGFESRKTGQKQALLCLLFSVTAKFVKQTAFFSETVFISLLTSKFA